MEITVKQMLQGAPALRTLGNEQLPARVAFRLSGVLRQVQAQLEAYESARIQTLEQAGSEKSEDGSHYQIPEDQRDEVGRQLNELLEETVEIDARPIPLSQLENASITAQQLMNLDWLIEEDGAEPPGDD